MEGVAAAGEGISLEELQLAARNHGMPLEGLRYDVTPIGMHYLLTHFDVPLVDERTWDLAIGGAVERPFDLTLAEIRARPVVTRAVTMECAGNGRARLSPRPISQPWLHEAVGSAEWTGTPLRPLLEDAGLRADATGIVLTGADRGVQGDVEQDYERSLSIAEALRDEVLLAYEINGQSLPPQHGFPLRLIVPGWYGMTSVKWLRRITAVTDPFDGYQQAIAYRYATSDNDLGTPVTRILPRALMVPPGIPDFFSRRRFVAAGACMLEGRAWSGFAPISRVEVSSDGGGTWRDARLGSVAADYCWVSWSIGWDAEPGDHELCCRGTDGAGNAQPIDQPWNLQGMSNNMIQCVPVTVRPRA